MNLYRGYRYLNDVVNGAVEKAIVKMSVESVTRAGAHTCLLGATAFAAVGFFESGYPSESEQAQILACADHLKSDASTASKPNLSPDCSEFAVDFATPEYGYSDYVLPSRDVFLEQELFTSHIDEERKADFSQSFSLLSVALAGYGFIYFRRRLENSELSHVGDQAEEWLRSQPGQ